MSLKTPLRFGLPKGSLEQSTFELLDRAGFNVQCSSRGYKPYINDPELDARLVRPQEMSRYVAQGFLDFGITGKDWIQESGHEVKVLCDLTYSKATSLPARCCIWDRGCRTGSPICTTRVARRARSSTWSATTPRHTSAGTAR